MSILDIMLECYLVIRPQITGLYVKSVVEMVQRLRQYLGHGKHQYERKNRSKEKTKNPRGTTRTRFESLPRDCHGKPRQDLSSACRL